jgi:hypothetical protein
VSPAPLPPGATPPHEDEEARLKRELALIKDRWLKSRADDVSWMKEAFFDQYNLITMFGLGSLTAATAILIPPLAPLGLSLLAAWELAWLGLAPSSERFRRAVRARHNAAQLLAQDDKRKSVIDELPLERKAQWEAANAIGKEIRAQAEAAPESDLDELDATLAKLDHLLEEYARMLGALHRITQGLRSPEAATIERRVESLEADVEALEPGRLRAAKEKNLIVLRQRAERFARSREEKELLEVGLDTLENTLKLARDQVVAATTTQGISSSLDQVLLELGRHRDHLQHVEDQLDEDTAPPAPAEPVALDSAPTGAVRLPDLVPDRSAPPPAPADASAKPSTVDEERDRWRKALGE